jgi:hypothetical protein
MTTLSNLELATGWTATGALGNDVPGSGTQAAYGLNQDAAFYINSPGPYGNGYMYRAIPVTADVTAARTFHYSFSFLLHAPQQTYVQALEYEFERHVAGTRLNFALQMDFVGGNFRHFDYVNSRWIANCVSRS